MNRLLFADRALCSRLMLAAAALLLGASLFLPLWFTEMTSPQYHGEEAIVVEVYPGAVAGSLREVQTLNQYIGVHLPLDAPELHAIPWVLGAIMLLTLIAGLVPEALRMKAMVADFALMLLAGATGAALLQYRLYQIGHDRGHAILRGVPDFTPPILGFVRVANFEITTGLMSGGWCIALAVVLTGLAIYTCRRPQQVWRPMPGMARVQVSR